MKKRRQDKMTLRTHKVAVKRLPKVDAKFIRETREKLHCSQAVFARKLRINKRTLEKWEQGGARLNPPAAVLILLVRKYPDMLLRLAKLGG